MQKHWQKNNNKTELIKRDVAGKQIVRDWMTPKCQVVEGKQSGQDQ